MASCSGITFLLRIFARWSNALSRIRLLACSMSRPGTSVSLLQILEAIREALGTDFEVVHLPANAERSFDMCYDTFRLSATIGKFDFSPAECRHPQLSLIRDQLSSTPDRIRTPVGG